MICVELSPTLEAKHFSNRRCNSFFQESKGCLSVGTSIRIILAIGKLEKSQIIRGFGAAATQFTEFFQCDVSSVIGRGDNLFQLIRCCRNQHSCGSQLRSHFLETTRCRAECCNCIPQKPAHRMQVQARSNLSVKRRKERKKRDRKIVQVLEARVRNMQNDENFQTRGRS